MLIKIARFKSNLNICILICLTSFLSSCGGSGSSSSSSPSGSTGVQTYGTLTVGTAAPLSIKSAVSNYVIPIYNNSESPVVLGTSISSSTPGVSFDLGACSGKTLNTGDECLITASYNGSGSASGVQQAIGT